MSNFKMKVKVTKQIEVIKSLKVARKVKFAKKFKVDTGRLRVIIKEKVRGG